MQVGVEVKPRTIGIGIPGCVAGFRNACMICKRYGASVRRRYGNDHPFTVRKCDQASAIGRPSPPAFRYPDANHLTGAFRKPGAGIIAFWHFFERRLIRRQKATGYGACQA